MNPPEHQIQIDIDETTARGVYTNLALITHSETEVIMDFVFLQPQNPKAKVMARVVSSPVHAKRLMMALKENLEKYETRFGPIRIEPVETPAKPVGFYQ